VTRPHRKKPTSCVIDVRYNIVLTSTYHSNMFRSSGSFLILVKMWAFKCGYAAAYGHSFCMLYYAERHVDMPLRTMQHAKRMTVCCCITKLEDSHFNQWFWPGSESSLMMIIWWSKHVGVILNVLVCDIWINVLIQTSALVWPLYIVSVFVWENCELDKTFWAPTKLIV
jgi:hypothetical protein